MRIKGAKISIIGAGWLGLPLAEDLRNSGAGVRISVTTDAKKDRLQERGWNCHRIHLNPVIDIHGFGDFFDCDCLIITIPPERREDIRSFYPRQIQCLHSAMVHYHIPHGIFISSTSVYPNTNGPVTEEDAVNPPGNNGKALLKAEDMLMGGTVTQVTVLRFGGLIGYDRNPVRYLKGNKASTKSGSAPVNLIHRDDCIGIIRAVIRQDKWDRVYNACAPGHPTRKEFYTLSAKKLGLELPTFNEEPEGGFKIVDSSSLMRELNYQFRFDDLKEVF